MDFIKLFKSIFVPKFSKHELLIFLVVLILSTLIKTLPILNYNFPFTTDQGRDMLALRSIVVGKDLTLIGPTTSLNGVFMGPFWYYFNVIPFILGKGDPSFLVYWNIFWYQLAGVVIWLTIRKSDKVFALISSVLFLTTPALFYTSRFSWSANPMPIFLAFFFLLLILILKQPTKSKALLLGIFAGIPMQIEASIGVLVFPYTLLMLMIYRKMTFRNTFFIFAGFFITLIPQVLFDFKNHFMMTQTLIHEFLGTGAVLGPKLSFYDTFFFHLNDFRWATSNLFEVPGEHIFLVYFLVMGFFLYKYFFTKQKKVDLVKNDFSIVSLLFLLLTFFFLLAYPYSIKLWYLTGLYIPLIFLAAWFFSFLYSSGRIAQIIGIFLIILLISNGLIFQKKFITGERSMDKSSLINQVATIDWVYSQARGKAFKVYNYVPSVYDFTYQYLFWWLSQNKYGYAPDTVTYLDNVPEYIPNNNQFWVNKKPATSLSPTFLIIEPNNDRPQHFFAWRGSFTYLCSLGEKIFPWSTKVEELKNCD